MCGCLFLYRTAVGSRAFKLLTIDNDCCVDYMLQHYDVGLKCRDMWGMGRWGKKYL